MDRQTTHRRIAILDEVVGMITTFTKEMWVGGWMDGWMDG